QRPAVPRDSARLLRVGRAGIAHQQVRDLPALLRPGDLMVLNDTRVLPARLLLRRRGDGSWTAMAKPVRRLRAGDSLSFGDGALAADVRALSGDGQIE